MGIVDEQRIIPAGGGYYLHPALDAPHCAQRQRRLLQRNAQLQGDAQNASGGAVSAPERSEGKSMGSAVTDAQKAPMTNYGQELAARAKPDMNQV